MDKLLEKYRELVREYFAEAKKTVEFMPTAKAYRLVVAIDTTRKILYDCFNCTPTIVQNIFDEEYVKAFPSAGPMPIRHTMVEDKIFTVLSYLRINWIPDDLETALAEYHLNPEDDQIMSRFCDKLLANGTYIREATVDFVAHKLERIAYKMYEEITAETAKESEKEPEKDLGGEVHDKVSKILGYLNCEWSLEDLANALEDVELDSNDDTIMNQFCHDVLVKAPIMQDTICEFINDQLHEIACDIKDKEEKS